MKGVKVNSRYSYNFAKLLANQYRRPLYPSELPRACSDDNAEEAGLDGPDYV